LRTHTLSFFLSPSFSLPLSLSLSLSPSLPEATNIQAFQSNFFGDTTVKIPDVYPELSSEKVVDIEKCSRDIETYIQIQNVYLGLSSENVIGVAGL
jgi:hypothetical protein